MFATPYHCSRSLKTITIRCVPSIAQQPQIISQNDARKDLKYYLLHARDTWICLLKNPPGWNMRSLDCRLYWCDKHAASEVNNHMPNRHPSQDEGRTDWFWAVVCWNRGTVHCCHGNTLFIAGSRNNAASLNDAKCVRRLWLKAYRQTLRQQTILQANNIWLEVWILNIADFNNAKRPL